MLQSSDQDVKSPKVWEWMCLGFWFDFSKQKVKQGNVGFKLSSNLELLRAKSYF